MTKSHFKKIVACLAASLTLSISGIFGVAPASAADDFPVYLLISPASQSLGMLEPGNTYSGEFMVKNIGTEEFDYKVKVSPYYVKDENYTSDFEVSNNYTYLSQWFEFSKNEGHLKPEESENVKYTVKVPLDVPGGAQNAAIVVSTDGSVDSSKTVSAVSQAIMKVYSQVNGQTNRCGKIIEGNIPSFLFKPPISASGRVENCGNVDLNVKYVMNVYPLFSGEEIYSNEDNPLVLATLPETRRYTNLDWEGTPSFGIFKVKLDVTYNNETKTFEKIVIVCPLWLVVLIIVFIGAVVFWLVSRSRERKNEKSER